MNEYVMPDRVHVLMVASAICGVMVGIFIILMLGFFGVENIVIVFGVVEFDIVMFSGIIASISFTIVMMLVITRKNVKDNGTIRETEA